MAESQTKKNSTIFPHAWFKSLEKLPDDVAGRIYKAVHRLDITGEMTVFEEGSIEDILFSQYAFQTKGFKQSYAETCENKSQAAKKREEKKKAQKAQQGTAEPQQNPFVDDRSGVEWIGKDRIGKDVSGGDVSGEDASAPPADTTTTTDLKKAIVDTWNSHDFVQKIKRVDSPQKRWERTEIAIELAGGKSHFLRLLQTLDEHAYLKDQPKSGYTVMYDWFTDPENFQNVLEGKYKNTRSKFGEGWEVVELG